MAVTGDYQYDLDGFTFGLGTSTSVTKISGLDMPEIDVSSQSFGNRHGATTAGRYLKERTIAVEGRINGTYSTFPGLRSALVRAFRPRDTDDDVVFTFRWPGAGNQIMYVKPQNLRGDLDAIATAVGVWDWQATLVAGDPRYYSETEKSQAFTLTGSQTLNNAGNFDAPTRIVFNGPLTNPRITNSTTGKTFQLTTTIASGQSWTVKSIDPSIYYGSTSKYATLDTTHRTFIELTPGDNTVALTASSGTGNATVYWRDTSL